MDKSRKTVDKEAELGKTHSFVRILKNLPPPDMGGSQRVSPNNFCPCGMGEKDVLILFSSPVNLWANSRLQPPTYTRHPVAIPHVYRLCLPTPALFHLSTGSTTITTQLIILYMKG